MTALNCVRQSLERGGSNQSSARRLERGRFARSQSRKARPELTYTRANALLAIKIRDLQIDNLAWRGNIFIRSVEEEEVSHWRFS